VKLRLALAGCGKVADQDVGKSTNWTTRVLLQPVIGNCEWQINILPHKCAARRPAYFLSTIIASRRLLDGILLARPKRVILVSSLGVYGSSRLSGKAVLDETADREQRLEKRDVYTPAKLRQQLLYRGFHDKAAFELAILRPGVIYGRGGPRNGAGRRAYRRRHGRVLLVPSRFR
jgi:nucleoside-diphosphate-sugar epimerase